MRKMKEKKKKKEEKEKEIKDKDKDAVSNRPVVGDAIDRQGRWCWVTLA